MDFALSEEQQALRELARKILGDLATHERVTAIERSGEYFDREVWSELAKANLLGAALPEAWGGSDFGFFALCVLLQEVGRAVAPIPALPTLLLGAAPIAEFGSDEQKQRFLPGVVAGEGVLTAALAEDGGDDPAAPQTTARRHAGGWRLDGLKIAVPAADLAQRMLVPARTSEGDVGVFLVDPGAEGVELERQAATSREPIYWVRLSGASVDADEVLGDPGGGARIARWLTERAVTGLCAVQLGVSERALEMTAEYGRTRQQFDRPIGSFQAFHTRAADAYIQLEAMRLTLWQAAWKLGEGQPAAEDVAVAKFWAAEGGQFVGYAAQHLHGGIGVDVDYPLHRYYLWAKQLELSLGSAHRALEQLAASIADDRG